MINERTWTLVLMVAFAGMLAAAVFVNAAPNGASIDFNSTATSNSTYPDNRSDAKGTINTMRLNVLQQNTKWKAYVGNTSGQLTLDDASGYTIYDWTITDITGEVYASRWSSISWGSIACASAATVTNEETALGVTASATDSIVSTFNWSGHRAFDVGTVPITGCNSTATYVNDSNPGQSAGANFQEALLQDGTAFIYAALINNSVQGYRNDSLYDFQMIVADNTTSGSPALTYFFYVELI